MLFSILSDTKSFGLFTECANKEERIIIVGAGASGVAAAVKLIENGYKNVKILEAEDRIGGRILSVPFGDNMVDLGANM